MIPSSVRSRIPVMTSLRASARAVVFSRSSATSQHAHSHPRLDDSKDLETYGFAATVPNSRDNTPMMRPQTPEEAIRTCDLSLTTLPQSDVQSSVNWDVSATGLRLWMAARAEAEQNGDTVAARSMLIDAMRYLNIALPSDLTALEVEYLRRSMSPLLFCDPSKDQSRQRSCQHGPPSVLRKLVAQVVCWFFALFTFVLPILMHVFNRIFQFERQHQVTEKLLSNSLDLGSLLGEPGSKLQLSMSRFRGSPIGGACVNAGAWFVDGLLGGVNDGMDTIAQGRTNVV